MMKSYFISSQTLIDFMLYALIKR